MEDQTELAVAQAGKKGTILERTACSRHKHNLCVLQAVSFCTIGLGFRVQGLGLGLVEKCIGFRVQASIFVRFCLNHGGSTAWEYRRVPELHGLESHCLSRRQCWATGMSRSRIFQGVEPKELAWSMAATCTSEAQAVPTGSQQASRAKVDISVTYLTNGTVLVQHAKMSQREYLRTKSFSSKRADLQLHCQ